MPAGIYVGYLRVNKPTQIDYRAYAYSPSNYTYCLSKMTHTSTEIRKKVVTQKYLMQQQTESIAEEIARLL